MQYHCNYAFSDCGYVSKQEFPFYKGSLFGKLLFCTFDCSTPVRKQAYHFHKPSDKKVRLLSYFFVGMIKATENCIFRRTWTLIPATLGQPIGNTWTACRNY